MSEKDPKKDPSNKSSRIQIRIPDKLAGGVYANNMVVSHTREEFVLDFMTAFSAGAGVVTARVIVSPGHLKRIVGALGGNLRRYEDRFGAVAEAYFGAALPPPLFRVA